ncbi:MAG: hypothetical protein H6540_00445 [Bacteroidales bacterium]|nr:hypothetical protein [Bacteroidales bacterium]MCB9013924.1 hypothetical protein [Bacteroidales bacterium]
MKKFQIIIITLFIFSGINVFCQEQESSLDSILDAILFEDDDLLALLYQESSYQYLYTGLNFNSKSLYAGRQVGPDQFDLSGQIHYFHSSGFNIGISGVAYSQFNPKYNTTVLTAGYFHKFKKAPPVSIRTSYSRYFFEPVDSVELSSFNSSLNLGTSYTRKHFGSSADVSFLFGDDFSTQLNLSSWGSFKLLKFGLSNKVIFEPELSVYFGNQTVIYGQFGVLSGTRWYDLFTAQTDIFGLMNTEIALPLTLSVKNFDLEAGMYIDFPRALGNEPKIDPLAWFGISISYMFDLSRK